MLHFGSVIFKPSKVILPPVGSSNKFKERRNVDFPEPDGPIKTTTSPYLISVEI